MLRLHPDRRAKAGELVHHNWLEGVVVQGEVDVVRRAEIEERERERERERQSRALTRGDGDIEDRDRTQSRGSAGKSKKGSSQTRHGGAGTGYDQDEVDALKPIEVGVYEAYDGPQNPEVLVVQAPVPPNASGHQYVAGHGGPPVLNPPPLPHGASGLTRTMMQHQQQQQQEVEAQKSKSPGASGSKRRK